MKTFSSCLKLKRKKSDNKGSKTDNATVKKKAVDSKLKTATVAVNKPDTLKTNKSISYSKPDTVSTKVNLSSKDSIHLKCQQNLIIHYPFDVAQLADSDKVTISQEIAKNRIGKITITGYTDSIGGDGKYNKQLSFRRAKIISMYLLDLGVDRSRILYNGLSSTSPLADNSTEQGRWLNRRTEVLIEYICK